LRFLIIGHGQLGGALARQLPAGAVWRARVPWEDADAAAPALRTAIRRFMGAGQGDALGVCWTAGSGFVGTSDEVLLRERTYLREVLDELRQPNEATPPLKLFFASSAGGVYAGVDGFADERTEPVAISPYGHSKILQERMVADWAARSEGSVLIGRISNLYGPGQNLAKPQGFISHLLVAMIGRREFTLTVPGHTIRDFVFTDDVARRIATWFSSPTSDSGVVTKVLAAGRSTNLVGVARIAGRVTRLPTKVLFAQSSASVVQPTVLRFVSRELVQLDEEHPARTLECGLRETWQAVLGRHAAHAKEALAANFTPFA
jgi:UDP-glucose 4-epimerase